MNESELEQGRRVRLTVDLDGGRYKAGDTGYLKREYFGANMHKGDWSVVFDQDESDILALSAGNVDGRRVYMTDVVEPIMPISEDLSEDTQEIKPIDQQFIEAAQEMELIKQLAIAQDALDKATEGTTVTFNGLIQLNDKRESAVKALIAFCRDRWLSDPVYAPTAEDPAHVSISGKVF